jgi:hypothetical protein
LPLRRFLQCKRWIPSCHQVGPRLSWSYGTLQSINPGRATTVIGFGDPLTSLALKRSQRNDIALNHRVFARPAAVSARKHPRHPLVGFRPPSECSACRAAVAIDDGEPPKPASAPPLRSLPLQRIPTRGSGFVGRVYLARPPAPSGYLNLLAPQSAPSLLALFHARSAHGVHPSEPCSSRAAVRRLRRRCPLDVAAPSNLPEDRFAERDAETPRPSSPAPIWEGLRDAPHLQGFAPHESPPLQAGCLGRPRRVALLGFVPSRVFPLTGMARPSPRLPSWDCPTRRRIDRADAPTGFSYPVRLACLSRDCRPSWGFPPHDPSRKLESFAVRESPPQAPGCVAVPLPSHL